MGLPGVSIAGPVPRGRLRTRLWLRRSAVSTLAASAALAALAAPVSADSAQPCAPEAVQRGNELWRAGRYDEAYAAFVGAIRPDSTCVAALVGAAMAILDVSLDLPADAQREQAARSAIALARRATVVAPRDAWGHVYLGASLGRLALFLGGKEKIDLAEAVGREAQLAVAADPENARAHHLLARWHREVASLGLLKKVAAKALYGGLPPGASMDQALVHFERAIALEPGRINHHLEYARTLRKVGRIGDALAQLRQIATLPSLEPRDDSYRKQARDLTQELEQAKRLREHGFDGPPR
jgi:tetratricopeptide (TPR) repeat protein